MNTASRKEYMRQYQREWMARRRADFFKDKKCVRCGSKRRLELDHIDPSKKSTHSIWSWAEARRKAELKKCQVLCRRCHIKKTNEDNGFGLQHGTTSGYNYYGCRCRLCTNAAVLGVNEWRWRTGRRKKRVSG